MEVNMPMYIQNMCYCGIVSYQIRSILYISVLSWNNIKWVVTSMITIIFGRCVMIICVWYIFVFVVVLHPLGNILIYPSTGSTENIGKKFIDASLLLFWVVSYIAAFNISQLVINFEANLYPKLLLLYY